MGELPALKTVSCRCACGTCFEGLAFFAKPGADGYVLRTCEGCAERAERRNTAKVTPQPRRAPRDTSPLRVPDDE